MGEKKRTVLVVEDDEQIAHLICFILEQDGYEVHRAADGKVAQDLIGRLAPPALVTLDIMLPHASGEELIVRIRATPGWERVPIVMLTAKPKEKEASWAIRAGAKAYLVKPFKPEELRAVVHRLAGTT